MQRHINAFRCKLFCITYCSLYVTSFFLLFALLFLYTSILVTYVSVGFEGWSDHLWVLLPNFPAIHHTADFISLVFYFSLCGVSLNNKRHSHLLLWFFFNMIIFLFICKLFYLHVFLLYMYLIQMRSNHNNNKYIAR